MKVTYESSNGIKYDLLTHGMIELLEANFHKHSWKYESIERKYGVNIVEFTRDPLEYAVSLDLFGTLKKRKETINELHDAWELDIISQCAGKLYWNDWYAECFIISTNTYPDKATGGTRDDINILIPSGFWVKEAHAEFLKQEMPQDNNGFDFSFDFKFDFTLSEKGYQLWQIEHKRENEFRMIIQGPCDNPLIYINEHPYQVFTTLEEGDYITIESRNHTVIKTMRNGQKINLYNSRQKTPSIFDKIPSGNNSVNWNGEFAFQIICYLERGEPRWQI